MKTSTTVMQITRAISKIRRDTEIKIADALEKAGEIILQKSQIYVPRETGALANSGRVEVEGQGFGARSRVLYGGDSAPYAVYVHENLEAQHKPPTCAKFLERAAREVGGTIAHVVARELDSETVTVGGKEVGE